YGYDAWGNIVMNSGSVPISGAGPINTYSYTGREYDAESGLYYYRARTYDPVDGRFLQKDRLQGELINPSTQNLYAYALNNPLIYTDPGGNQVAVEYAFILTAPSIQQQAASLIGFLQGYAVPNLSFIGEFLGLINNGGSVQDVWDEAVART